MGNRSARPGPWFIVVALALVLFPLAGCKNMYTVKGQLQWEDGQPLTELAGFDVMFSSQELQKMARGVIKDDGTFELGTERERDGVIPGEYAVTVTQPHRAPDRPETRNPIVHLDYEDPERTPLKVTVKAESNYFTFKLKPIGRRSK
jgi:hypothetical protein